MFVRKTKVQTLHLCRGTGHGHQHPQQTCGGLPHHLGGVLVEGEGGGGAHQRQPVLQGGQLAPEAGGIRDDQVGPEALDVV